MLKSPFGGFRMKTKSNLERVLEAGHFAVTAEIGSPQSIEPELIRGKANLIKGCVDAFNVPDGQAAVVAMGSWAACLIGMEQGLDPIVHMTCRDRNRIALQMDILGIAAFGVNNILCLSGDPISYGNHPQAKPVLDLDSIQLIRMVKGLRDEKRFEVIYDKKVIDVRPNLSWNKGTALEVLMSRLGRYPVIYIGDDRTDEDAFMKLRNATTVVVSRRPQASAAHYYLKSIGDVTRFLQLFNSWLQQHCGN